MKKIINGVSFNIGASKILGAFSYDDVQGEVTATVYLTKKGDVFIVRDWKVNGELEYNLEPISKDKLLEEIIVNGRDVDNLLTEALANVSEREPRVSMLLRVPISLHQVMECAADDDGLSINSWAIRCFKSYLNAHGDGHVV